MIHFYFARAEYRRAVMKGQRNKQFRKTRSKSRHCLFGQTCELPRNQLPTCEDVFRDYCYNEKCTQFHTGFNEQATLLANKVKEIYMKASIPTVEFSSIVVRVKRLISKVRELEKYPECKRSSAKFQDKLSSFSKLFDICCCKCFNDGARGRSQCTCRLALKIPTLEWEFWIDQQTTRNMKIGNTDRQETSKLKRKQTKSSPTGKGKQMKNEIMDTEVNDLHPTSRSDTESEAASDESKDKLDNSTESSESSVEECHEFQNRRHYPELSKAVDRCGVSNRDTCLLVNAFLKDMELLSSQTIIDPAKLRRQRKYWREREIEQHSAEAKNLICLGFDGKQDSTLLHRRILKEEHYVIVAFPGETYIDHVVPQSSKAVDIGKEIMSIIVSTQSSLTLQAIVCDGTNTNTGKNNGIIRRLEKSLGRPLQWLICLLHANELPFRKYFSVVDGGETKGPKTSCGEIGSVLDFDPKDKPVVAFMSLPGKVVDISENVKKELNTDQLYFLRVCLAVQKGYHNNKDVPFLQMAQPGNLNHSRWLTKANRILRLYMSETAPSEPLMRIVKFIVNFYGPSWFYIKTHSSCQDGARNIFYMLQLLQDLDPSDQEIIFPVIQNNNYFSHPENILLAAVGDDDEEIRKFATEKIITARQNFLPSEVIRTMDKNTVFLQSSATSYVDMIDWTKCNLTPPPLLSHILDHELKMNKKITLEQFPCHSQAIERAIKDVSSASCKVFGHKSRHGMVLLCKKSRKELPKVQSKADFM
jgi:hypothetical protein